ncbi:MAG: MATE family efflux transporter [Spirochaetales bacterium]|nr:MATE family efflux transporter [Spirochaetales bacterium]
MTNDRELILKEAPVNKAITSLAVPAIIGMMVNAVYNIVDTLFVGMLHDTTALGATTVLFPIFMLISAVGMTFGMGTATVISRKLGKQDKEAASHAVSTAFFTTLGIAIIFTILGTIFVTPLLRLFGATETILDQAEIYGSIIIAFSVFQMLNMNMNNALRAEGAAKMSAAAIALGAVLNIILDPVFMFVLDMGLAGAAVATVTGQGISTIFLLSYYLRKKSMVRLSLRRFQPSVSIYKQIMAIGIPTFLRQALSSFAMAMLTNAAAPFGDSAIAAIGITLRVSMMPMMVLFGFSQGFQPMAGYAYGAKNYARVRESVKFSIGWTTKFATAVGVLLFIFAGLIMSAFTRDPEVLERGTLALRLSVIIMPTLGIQLIYAFLYQALGRGKPSLLLAVARQGIFFLPLVLIMPGLLGLTGVYIAQPIADALTVGVSIILAVKINRELKIKETEAR